MYVCMYVYIPIQVCVCIYIYMCTICIHSHYTTCLLNFRILYTILKYAVVHCNILQYKIIYKNITT